MISRRLFALLVSLLVCSRALVAADAPVATTAATAEFKLLVPKIQAKLQQPGVTEATLAGELKEFDALIAKYQSQKTDEVAQIILSEATLLFEVLQQREKAMVRLRQLRDDFPETEPGKLAASALRQMERREAAKNLEGRAAPELRFTWASREGLKTLADLKGKVVVLDFWATWCGPCVASFSDLRELTARYKGFPVEIVGVTTLQGRIVGLEPAIIDCEGDPKKEMGLMATYIKAKELTWTVAISDEEKIFMPDYDIDSIPHMTIVAPDGTVRNNSLDPREPLSDKAEKIDALLKEFKLRTPPPVALAR